MRPPKKSRALRLAGSLQHRLTRFYRLEAAPAVADFVRPSAEGGREALQVLETPDGALELALHLPRITGEVDLDAYCQVIEGVSHFVYLAERARTELPATHLELELQAEIDKYVVLARLDTAFEQEPSRALRARLYEHVRFCHDAGTPLGERYRLANDLAARLVGRLETYLRRGRIAELREALVRFYRMGQTEKIRFAQAA